jgi:DNA-directed RNA polymerase alpha subunit
MNKIEKLERERTDLRNKYYEETKAITEKIKQEEWVKRKAALKARQKEKLIGAKRDEQIKEEYDRGEITLKKLGAKYNLSGSRVRCIIQEVERRQRALRVWKQKRKEIRGLKKELQDGNNDTTPFGNRLATYDIYFLNMNVRTSNCLISEQIYTVGDLIQKSERELLRAPNLGRKTLNDIKYTLNDWGLKLNTKLYSYRGESEYGS